MSSPRTDDSLTIANAPAWDAYRSADLLVRVRAGHDLGVCVVTFDSFTDCRTIDRQGFGEAFFAARKIDAVHILSRDNDWYLLPDIELALAAAARATSGHKRVLAYGSSMGAYAAIRFGRLAGAGEAFALSPQFSLDPSFVPFEYRWKADASRLDFSIERRLYSLGFVESAIVLYDPRDLDRRHVDLFRDHVNVRDVRLPGAGHPVTGYLAELEILQRAILEVVRGTFDADAFAREAFRARRRSPQYYRTLSQRPRAHRWKAPLARRAYELAPSDAGYVSDYAQALVCFGVQN